MHQTPMPFSFQFAIAIAIIIYMPYFLHPDLRHFMLCYIYDLSNFLFHFYSLKNWAAISHYYKLILKFIVESIF